MRWCCLLCLFALNAVMLQAVIAQQHYAFVVGVEDYNPDQLRQLKYPEDDASALAERLKSLGFHVMLMTGEESNPQYKPSTPAKILNALDGRLKGIEKDDVLIVAMTGHGVQFTDEKKLKTGSRETYFCPEDAELTDKSTLIPLTREVLARIHRCPAERKLVLIDACRNEMSPKAGDLAAKLIKVESVHEHPRTLPKGMSVMFSCSPTEQAWEHDDLKHSVFSNFVLEYFDGKASDDLYDRRVPTIDGLVTYTRQKTNRFVLDHISSGGQLPSLIGDRESWTIASNKAQHVFENGIGARMRLIPAGSFLMGSTDKNQFAQDNERPRHQVVISKSFYMSETEVTQSQWKAVMKTEPWNNTKHESDRFFVTASSKHPATFVTWHDATEFCRRLSDLENRAYRLPTEAEWEYACRAGTQSLFWFGNDLDSAGEFEWIRKNTKRKDKHTPGPVGTKKPNGFGLFDMHGNVTEWCFDWFREDFYSVSEKRDPRGPETGHIRVMRGGNFYEGAFPSAFRPCELRPNAAFWGSGFRIVCVE